jgi:hypothetical protein
LRKDFSRLKAGGIGAIEERAETNIEAKEQISQRETPQAELANQIEKKAEICAKSRIH